MSHRYGSQMLPSQIDKEVFDLISKAVDDDLNLSYEFQSESISIKIENLLDYCYKEDKNIVPSIFRLLDINKIVPGFDYQA